MFTRKIGKLIRGKVTPFQVFLGCLFGVLLGMLPSPLKAPGLYLLFFVFVMILNVNLLLCAILTPLSKLLYYLVLPLLYQTGLLLSGNMAGLYKTMNDTPILAWFGLEYYVTTGGLIWGCLLGVVLGIILNRSIASIRKKLGELEENSEKYKEWESKKIVKILTFIFVGGKKKTYNELLEKKVGNPIRIIGLVGVVGFVVLMYCVIHLTRNDVMKYYLTKNLEAINGATVDVEEVRISMTHATLKIKELGFCDPENLNQNRLVLKSYEADLDINALLRKRFYLEKLNIGEVLSDQPRESVGSIVKSPEPKIEEIEASPSKSLESKESSGEKTETSTLESYFKQYEEIKSQLEPYEEWAKKFYQQVKESKKIKEIQEAESERKKEEPVTPFEEMLRGLVSDQGYEAQVNYQTIVKKPMFLIEEIKIEKIKIPNPVLENSSVEIKNLNSYPSAWDKPITFHVTNIERKIDFTVALDSLSSSQNNSLSLQLDQIDGHKIGRELKINDSFPLKSGDIRFELKGEWNWSFQYLLTGTIQLLNGVILYEGNELEIDKLDIPIVIKGSRLVPSFETDGKNLMDQIKKIANDRLKKQAIKEFNQAEEEARSEFNNLLKKGLNKDNAEESGKNFLDKQKEKGTKDKLKDLFKK